MRGVLAWLTIDGFASLWCGYAALSAGVDRSPHALRQAAPILLPTSSAEARAYRTALTLAQRGDGPCDFGPQVDRNRPRELVCPRRRRAPWSTRSRNPKVIVAELEVSPGQRTLHARETGEHLDTQCERLFHAGIDCRPEQLVGHGFQGLDVVGFDAIEREPIAQARRRELWRSCDDLGRNRDLDHDTCGLPAGLWNSGEVPGRSRRKPPCPPRAMPHQGDTDLGPGSHDVAVKAWRVHEYGAPREALSLDDVDEPSPGADELKIRVTSSDPELQRPRRHPRPVQDRAAPGSVHPGHGGARHRRRLRRGRRAVDRSAPVVRDPVGRFGGYARIRAVAPASMAFEMPSDMPEAEAAAIFMPFHLAWLALYERAHVQANRDVARACGRGRRGLGRAAARRAGRRTRARDRGVAGEDTLVPRARGRACDQLSGDRLRRGGTRRDRRPRRRCRLRRGQRRRDDPDVPVHGVQRPAHPRRVRVGYRTGGRRPCAAARAVRQLLVGRRVPRVRGRPGDVQAVERVQLSPPTATASVSMQS